MSDLKELQPCDGCSVDFPARDLNAVELDDEWASSMLLCDLCCEHYELREVC